LYIHVGFERELGAKAWAVHESIVQGSLLYCVGNEEQLEKMSDRIRFAF